MREGSEAREGREGAEALGSVRTGLQDHRSPHMPTLRPPTFLSSGLRGFSGDAGREAWGVWFEPTWGEEPTRKPHTSSPRSSLPPRTPTPNPCTGLRTRS